MVAMSGGVDSSVTAALLLKQGYEVHGVFMALAQSDLAEQVSRVEKVADFLGVSLDVVDLASAFQREVIDYFRASYGLGRTPNPCIVCNPLIKFGKLLEYGATKGVDLMATGHYVRVEPLPGGRVRLLQGSDPKKDQSYFLCKLAQSQLQRLVFPLGMSEKTKVYEMAAHLGLGKLHGSESQDVCFLQDQSVYEFLADHLPGPEGQGDIVTATGKVLGRHQGIFRYTVGQRRGLGIPDATPYYVIALDPRENRVIVGKEDELLADSFVVHRMNWTAGVIPSLPEKFLVKIRYRHSAAPAIVTAIEGGFSVQFDEAQRAITPGQFAVLYLEDEVIGGGEIDLE